MRRSVIVRFCTILSLSLFFTTLQGNTTAKEDFEFDKYAVQARLNNLNLKIIAPQYTPAVESYIKTYVIKKRDKAEKILGRIPIYFPMFESYLAQRNMPDDLKYLAVVESALEPRAVSRVGATGLWQFMAPTASDVGLVMNRHIDERRDPHKSTQAAIEYLYKQYNRFNDWALALAAYNSGSGRVSRAVKRARSTNFWKVQNYLPRETRNYVPAFIAASYFIQHYEEHDLIPNYPELDVQITKTITTHNYLTFYSISKITGVSLDVIELLNPAYKQGFIPSSSKGNTLTLPKRVAPAMEDYLSQQTNIEGSYGSTPNGETIITGEVYFQNPLGTSNHYYNKTVYYASKGETIEQIASYFDIEPHLIKAWNGMKYSYIHEDKELFIYISNNDVSSYPSGRSIAVAEPEVPQIKRMATLEKIPTLLKPIEYVDYIDRSKSNKKSQRFQYYTVQKGETLQDISDKFEGITIPDLMILNQLKEHQIPQEGTKIKLRKL